MDYKRMRTYLFEYFLFTLQKLDAVIFIHHLFILDLHSILLFRMYVLAKVHFSKGALADVVQDFIIFYYSLFRIENGWRQICCHYSRIVTYSRTFGLRCFSDIIILLVFTIFAYDSGYVARNSAGFVFVASLHG